MIIDLRRRPLPAQAVRWDGTETAMDAVLELAGKLASWAKYSPATLHLVPEDRPLVVLHLNEWLVRLDNGRLVALTAEQLEEQFEHVDVAPRLAAVAG